MLKIEDKYKNIFLVERENKVTMFFLSKLTKSMSMDEYINTHHISDDIMNKYTNNVMDFYNDMIKFQNKEKLTLNHMTLLSYSESEISKYITNMENVKNFASWVTVDDKKWLDKIQKYFLNDRFFEKSDRQGSSPH